MNDKKTYLIAIKSSDELERLTVGGGYIRHSPEKITAIRNANQRMMKPVQEYLDSLGLKQNRDYQLQENLGTITVSLTQEQASQLRRQSFVEVITEDFRLEHIE